MKIKKVFVENEEGLKRFLDTEVYITTYKGFKHINSPKEFGCCPICNEKHSLQSHHVIPKRLTKKKGALGELRIKICNECHKKIHPENQMIEMLKRLLPQLVDLTENQICRLPIYKELEEIISLGTNNND